MNRSVREFVDHVRQVLGEELTLLYIFRPRNTELRLGDISYSLGAVGENHLLTPAEQAAIWEYFFGDLDPALIGLDPRGED